MAQKSFFARRWKLLLNIVTFVALAGLAYAIRHQLGDTIDNLHRVNGWVLLLIVPLEVLGYHAQAKMYQQMFRTTGTEISYKGLLKASLELNFVNHVFPSGGVSGISYFGLRMRALGARASQATLVQTMKLVLTFLSFEALLFFGMFELSVHGKTSNLTTFIGTFIATFVIVGTAVFAYVIGSKSRINAFFTFMTKLLNRVIQIVRWRQPETIRIDKARAAFDEFHGSYMELRNKTTELKGPLWWGFVYNLTEVLVIYVVYIAFGEWVDLGAIILAYAVANFAGLVSILPGGIGVYEGLMTAVLASAGISPGLSLPVTVMYRVLNTLLQVPPGYYLYHRSLRKAEPPEEPHAT
ncbi:MAG TPA: lysylphosphatidylglycerol synthase transmembrane domain-containing protein [Candidatus Microsaccharimonas sp.]|nr:lysylphosphatidylglycerol synthase transmembrane domain-containing protein [Candidatus Microsaccharimonas sp.]